MTILWKTAQRTLLALLTTACGDDGASGSASASAGSGSTSRGTDSTGSAPTTTTGEADSRPGPRTLAERPLFHDAPSALSA